MKETTIASALHVVPRTCPPGRLGKVRYAGSSSNGRGLPNRPPRRFDAFGLMYLWKGRGIYQSPHYNTELQAGDLVYVVPEEPHWYGVTNGDTTWCEVFIVFEGPVFELCQQQGLIDAQRPVTRLLPIRYWRSRIDSFRTRRAPRTATDADLEVVQVLGLLAEIASYADRGGSSAETAWLDESQALLCRNLSEPLDLREVAKAVGMPYETWRRRFRSATGMAPAHFRLRHRLEVARHLLRQTSLPIADIAASVGFTDEAHLARHFRAYVGVTAGQYRRGAKHDFPL
ncbi:MAG TPA: helix-turn-helix domain-containing protein [Actinopolymorphaceae bacterium]